MKNFDRCPIQLLGVVRKLATDRSAGHARRRGRRSSHPHGSIGRPGRDFTTDSEIFRLSLLSVVVGVIGASAALALMRLIGLVALPLVIGVVGSLFAVVLTALHRMLDRDQPCILVRATSGEALGIITASELVPLRRVELRDERERSRPLAIRSKRQIRRAEADTEIASEAADDREESATLTATQNG